MGSYDTEAEETADRLDDKHFDTEAADLVRSMARWIDGLEKADTRTEGQKNTTRGLIADMAKLHVRAHAHPLPQHPAALHWQIAAGFYAALSARMLHHLDGTDPRAATEITEWAGGPLDADADLEQISEWIAVNVAGGWDGFKSWADEAKTEAEQAAQNTSSLPSTI